MNKAQAKKDFHLTEKDLEALPKQIVQKEGAKRPSKISFSAQVIFDATKAKSGKRALRSYQAAAYPSIARRLVEADLEALQQKHPSLAEKGRVATVARLRAGTAEAARGVSSAQAALAQATAALEAAHRKEERAQRALEAVATASELEEGASKRQRVGEAGPSSAGQLVD